MMNSEYIPLYFPGFENFPQNKKELITGLEEKIAYCKSKNDNKSLKIIADKMTLGVEWLKSISENMIPQLSGLEYYRLGVTNENIFSIQIWQRLNKKDKLSFKKNILIISDKS